MVWFGGCLIGDDGDGTSVGVYVGVAANCGVQHCRRCFCGFVNCRVRRRFSGLVLVVICVFFEQVGVG